ncbi:DoxX family membrane protein [Chitinimonas sp. BJYL2]|uniref:DoxX family membrane protein n=1 Tax=Chitinimonas sp. BJYL2 TaxID=2976696 RepID=UPI0022B57856|nr:DoxX family membrane protein [Chitinimonas sp. BJYL2]
MHPATAHLIRAHQCLVHGLAQWLAPIATLVTRLYVAQVFFRAGLSKIEDWDTTVFLFTEEYRTPLLSPALAALAGTAGELILPVLLALGLAGRLGALGLFAVNAMAVVSYWHVLGTPEQAAGLTHHLHWGLLLMLLAGYGPGKLSLDTLLTRWCGKCSASH